MSQMKRITLEVRYHIGDVVYRVCDPRQAKHIVYGYSVSPGNVRYNIEGNERQHECYDFELSGQPDELQKLTSDE